MPAGTSPALHGCARHVWTARTAGMASAGGGGAHLLEEVARLILQQSALLHDVVEQLARLRARARGVRPAAGPGDPDRLVGYASRWACFPQGSISRPLHLSQA